MPLGIDRSDMYIQNRHLGKVALWYKVASITCRSSLTYIQKCYLEDGFKMSLYTQKGIESLFSTEKEMHYLIIMNFVERRL